ncbi:OmpA family protein [Zestomonas carbonaria]|uniref:Peptidoglycan-associated lipoprotein n=1 Tax=Zestomonas carbonaria TaxID=2762745 RepID=A0A7U7EQB6_9GAMM|nr:OmpA family protein [Pseudomonas carbonaria]CAD5109232.1 Peptidoglycan-associated lipoprotein [Pseudomonas carbonaria]
MRTLLLKTATLVFCMTAAGCSILNLEKKTDEVVDTKIDRAATTAWLDIYEPRLREGLQGSKFEVKRHDTVLVVTAPVDSSFNPDRPGMLMPSVLGPITKVAKLVEGDPQTAVLVLGHADSSGEDQLNRKLSHERAVAVASIFRLSGLRGDRLMLKGMGSDMPRAANDSKEGRSLNRRVEVVLTPQHTLVALLAQYSRPAPPQPALAASQSE